MTNMITTTTEFRSAEAFLEAYIPTILYRLEVCDFCSEDTYRMELHLALEEMVTMCRKDLNITTKEVDEFIIDRIEDILNELTPAAFYSDTSKSYLEDLTQDLIEAYTELIYDQLRWN